MPEMSTSSSTLRSEKLVFERSDLAEKRSQTESRDSDEYFDACDSLPFPSGAARSDRCVVIIQFFVYFPCHDVVIVHLEFVNVVAGCWNLIQLPTVSNISLANLHG